VAEALVGWAVTAPPSTQIGQAARAAKISPPREMQIQPIRRTTGAPGPIAEAILRARLLLEACIRSTILGRQLGSGGYAGVTGPKRLLEPPAAPAR
jgi:hypothetical protein